MRSNGERSCVFWLKLCQFDIIIIIIIFNKSLSSAEKLDYLQLVKLVVKPQE